MAIMISQMSSMAIVVAFGYFLGKFEILTEKTVKEISNLLMRFVIPVLIVRAFDRPFFWDQAFEIFLVILLSVLIMAISIGVARVAFTKDERIEKYATVFSNKGFVGIPLVESLLGPGAVLYCVPTVAISNVFVWTYGNNLLGAKTAKGIRGMILNPSTMGFLVGLVVYLLPWQIPTFLRSSMDLVAAINTPLAMMILGVSLCKEPFSKVFNNKVAYKVAALRLILVPVIMAFIMMALPTDNLVMKQATVIIWAVPTALNLSMFARITGQDPSYAAQITALTTILSLATLPLVTELSLMLFK